MDTQILWFASRATGAVSLVLFTAVMVLGIITSGRLGLPGLPRAGVLRLHRNLSLVSVAFLALNVVNQALWLTWSVMVGETSIMLCATTLGTLMMGNVIWAGLRRQGVVRARLAELSA